jgi:hypothetical protein
VGKAKRLFMKALILMAMKNDGKHQVSHGCTIGECLGLPAIGFILP